MRWIPESTPVFQLDTRIHRKGTGLDHAVDARIHRAIGDGSQARAKARRQPAFIAGRRARGLANGGGVPSEPGLGLTGLGGDRAPGEAGCPALGDVVGDRGEAQPARHLSGSLAGRVPLGGMGNLNESVPAES